MTGDGAVLHGGVMGALLAGAILFSPAATSSGDLRINAFAPRIENSEPAPSPTLLDELRARGAFTPTVRTETYDDRLAPHPLIQEAVAVLTEELQPYAQRVFVTSLVRSPEDQMRLMSERRYRYWTTERSKHLLGGFAADLGFVRRKANMWKLQSVAEKALVARLGEEKAKKLRVVREARCIHVEIDTLNGREDIEQRVDALYRWKMIRHKPEGPNPVPALEDYVPEGMWKHVPKRTLTALPG